MLKRSLLAVSLVSLLLTAHAIAQTTTFNGQSWWDYVKVLAADDMEGRETGSAGLRKASTYVVEQLKKSGLEPAGTNGYLPAREVLQPPD